MTKIVLTLPMQFIRAADIRMELWRRRNVFAERVPYTPLSALTLPVRCILPTGITKIFLIQSICCYPPYVNVFRDASLELLEEPYTVVVMTVAAPNLNDPVFRSVSRAEIEQYMKLRIRQYLECAAYYGYLTIPLGAWGCGAFGHDARDVDGYFKEILIGEGFCKYF